MASTPDAELDDPLTLEDYRSLLGVVEDVTSAQSVAELCHRLGDALARHFGWVGAFDVTTLTVDLADDGTTSPRRRAISSRLGLLLKPWFTALSYNEPSSDLGSLTGRERDVVQLVADALTNRQIATRLGVSTDTVKKHLSSAMTKSGCANRTQLALLWRHGRHVSPGSGSNGSPSGTSGAVGGGASTGTDPDESLLSGSR
jgi:DNA-binding CsgD family transcriptional regulator